MIVESRIVAQGMNVRVIVSRRLRGYSAELRFEDGDHTMLDAPSLAELERLVEMTAGAAAAARQCVRASHRPHRPEGPAGAPRSRLRAA